MQPIPINPKLRPLSDLLLGLLPEGVAAEQRELMVQTLSAVTRDRLLANARGSTNTYVVFAVYGGLDDEAELVSDVDPAASCPNPVESNPKPAPQIASMDDVPMLDLYGSKGESQDWKLVPDGGNGIDAYVDGAAIIATRTMPTLGKVESIELVMPKGHFSQFCVFDLGGGVAYLFDTSSKRAQELPIGRVWEGEGGEPLPLSAPALKRLMQQLSLPSVEDLVASTELDARYGEVGAALIRRTAALLHAEPRQSRYDVIVSAAGDDGLDVDGQVQVMLRTPSGLVTLNPSARRDSWATSLGRQAALMTKEGGHCKVQTPLQVPATLNFPTVDDSLSVRHAFFAYEGPDSGVPESIAISVSTGSTELVRPYAADLERQRDAAISICQRLLQGFSAPGKTGPAWTDDCTSIEDDLKQLSMELQLNLDEASCKQVKTRIANPTMGAACQWVPYTDDSRLLGQNLDALKMKLKGFKPTQMLDGLTGIKGAWHLIGKNGKPKTRRCEYYKPVGGDTEFKNICVDVLGKWDNIFFRSRDDSGGKDLLLQSAYVIDYRTGYVRQAMFDGEFIVEGETAERELL